LAELPVKFRSISLAHDSVAGFEDHLNFNMSQKDLAMLLCILIKADFVDDYYASGSSAPQFFSKYFYFKNQKADNDFTRASGINKKISEAMSIKDVDYNQIKIKLKSKLLEALQQV